MNYLELLQKAIEKSGAREDEPDATDFDNATGLLRLFKSWVQDAWVDLQLESNDWWFRTIRNQTIAISQSTDEYTLSATLDSINERTVSIYQTGQGTDETPLEYIDYETWRTDYDTRTFQEGRPTCFTIAPDGKVVLFPVPDGSYTLRFDAVRALEELDTADDTDEPTGLPTKYHPIIYWGAVMKYATHYEDGSKYVEAEAMFKKYHERIEARQKPRVRVKSDALYRDRYY